MDEEKEFLIERAKTGRAACKKCKEKCENGELRIAKLVPNFFAETGKLKHWYHIDCIFEVFKTQRSTTKKIESVDDIEGWSSLAETEKDSFLEKLHSIDEKPITTKKTKTPIKKDPTTSTSVESTFISNTKKDTADNLFCTFREICEKIASVNGYLQKTKILQTFLIKGTNGKRFEGDFYLWFKMLLPSAVKRIYNVQSKQLIKLFSKIFQTDQFDMLNDLEKGDVSETIRKYFHLSKSIKPNEDNKLTLKDVDLFLDRLTKVTKEDDQIECFERFSQTCNADDLKMVIRLIKHDLRMNAGPRHILDALGPNAYTTFQTLRDLQLVVGKFSSTITKNQLNFMDSSTDEHKMKDDKIPNEDDTAAAGSEMSSSMVVNTIGQTKIGGVKLMSPISPMLAEACKSVEKAIMKNPEGMYSEIKYDGERVQIHKCGNEFKFFSRNLKPVLDHKISRCKEFIPKAFPKAQDLIIDSEIIVVNTETGELLPFGTLGIHKREQFTSSEVCLFVFDCIYYNGEDLTKRPLLERKKILKENLKPIKYHVELSEYYLINTKKELASMTAKVLKAGLEGLVLKNTTSLYQPGKRGWLKIKKDYLFKGQMADTADLVVLGGWFGTGKKGGMLSIFLMGCYDIKMKLWKTVTKVHSGLDDNTMENLQDELKILMQRANPDKPPNWISCKKPLIPDFIAIDPLKMPVWEITGAEFTKSHHHTANGISIRFPRVTKIREDKSTLEATNLKELELLFKNSKDHLNVEILFKDIDDIEDTKMVDIKTKFFDPNKSFDNPATTTSNNNSSMSDDSTSFSTILNDIEEIERKYVKRESSEDNKEDIKKKLKLENIELNDIKYSSSIDDSKKTKKDIKDFFDGKKKMRKLDEKSINIKKENSELFDGIAIYIETDIDDDYLHSSIRKKFQQFGGAITKISRAATHAVHLSNKVNDSYVILRAKYQPTCRHLTYKWIIDSIAEEKLLPPIQYAVGL